MYVIKEGDGRKEPITYSVHESYKGEARDIILQQFCFDTALYEEYTAKDEVDDKEISLLAKDYLDPEEIKVLEEIEKNAPDEFWETVTLDTIKKTLRAKQVQEDIGDQQHELRKDSKDGN